MAAGPSARISVLAPLTGRVLPIEQVPDPVFAERMLGDGIAIDPSEGIAVAPVSGTLIVFHSAGHAFAIQEEASGIGVLVHVGLDTVDLKGRGFERLAEQGDAVRAGQTLLRFDLETIAAAGLSAVSPIVLPELDAGVRVSMTTSVQVVAGQDVLFTIEPRG
jgi:glucose-specific phosphotransferase system IIA component